ncbi:alpha/beta fold hydrolase [Streptomyces resistomycificus]|uniref:Alpha/beta hydrolase n=1 Tax=Streptomyces resistomycificus TaxID=67356 RepID=A0A0L8LXS8_9ACTN|nr:alpha/beta hydrolase [Streptomyces resistomycificus]KOG42894.1 alpha/beta hydrolase [Streptomyces resistomycificus]KUO01483.1 alpha/beta hydrolase [Streptomyces resistomycificus]
MPTFPAPDGTRLAYHVSGDGPPLICLPGGPMQDSAYLGDLGGLTAHRALIRLDLRGTGHSAAPDDPASYRCDRLVDDVEALRKELGLGRPDLLGHSAGANLAALYTARHPDRVARLALINPSVYAVGVEITAEDRLGTARLRRDEVWFTPAYTALEAIAAGRAAPGDWEAVAPFWFARWDEKAKAAREAEQRQRNDEAAAVYGSEGAFSPAATRAALGRFAAPVLVMAGEVDVAAPPRAVAEYAGLFPNAELVVQPGAAHFPWLDDAGRFVTTFAERG